MRSKNALETAKKIHFIGIGGIGISAIARMLVLEKKNVSGSDVSANPVTEELEKLGVKIFVGQSKNNIGTGIDLVIYTIAIAKNNPELVRAKQLGIEVMSYPQALGVISKNKFTVAIAGTHGKTTTTAMIAKICIDAKLGPTVILGSLLKGQNSNFIAGKSNLFIVEACEYKKSFLNLSPDILAITNIDNDHLDYYKNIKNIQRAFTALAKKVPKNGFIISDANNNLIGPVVKNLNVKVIDYNNEQADIKLKIPGQHNLANARVALAISRALKIPISKAIGSLAEFDGTWRRFEYKGQTKSGALVYDDYAHHPTEITTTLVTFRKKFPALKLTVIFQPHLYSRTKILFKEFGRSFKDADLVILVPIYAAREKPDKITTSEKLAKELGTKGVQTEYYEDFNELTKYLTSPVFSKKDIILTMGAGDIYKLGEKIIHHR